MSEEKYYSFQRILKFFPEAEAGVLQYETYKKSGEK